MTARSVCGRPGILGIGLFVLVAAVVGWAASCSEPAPIVVGGLVSETGAAQRYGQLAREGMDLALEEINAQGGLPNGRQLRIEYRDDGSSPEKARAAVAELIRQVEVNAIVGGVTSAVAEGVLPQLIDKEVVLISPSASSPRLTSMGGGWFFRDYPSDTAEVRSMASLARRLETTEAAVIAQNEAFGQGLAEIFTGAFQGAGGKIVLQQNFSLPLLPDEAVALAQKVVASKATAVYLAGWEGEVAALIDALQVSDFRGIKLASSAVSPEIIRLSGRASERLVFPQSAINLETGEPHVKAFVEAFKKKYDRAPSAWAAYGYDAVKVLATALGKTRMGTAAEIKEQLTRLEYAGVTGPIKFDPKGDITREPHLYAVINGEMVHFEETDKDLRGMLLP